MDGRCRAEGDDGRTTHPDERFAALPDFPWSPHYVDDLDGTHGLRVAYVDEGPKDAAHTFLCLHGEPTWSFLYRKMIPVFLEAGGRVVAPDFLGFGRSDKPVNDADYTVDLHRTTILSLLERLDLQRITLVCQDWGGLVGLTLPLDQPERFARLIIMNTAFPIGRTPGPGFLAWRDYVRSRPDFDVGRLMKRSAPGLTGAELAAYDAPFPDVTFKGGVRTFPDLVPTSEDADSAVSELGRRAREWWSNTWSGPSFMAIGAQDPVLGPPVMQWMQKQIRNCPEPMVIEDAGHFVQEAGDRVARAALAAFAQA